MPVRSVTLHFVGPVTPVLWATVKPVPTTDAKVYCGRGVNRLEATQNAIKTLRAECTEQDRACLPRWSQQALELVKQHTRDPYWIEGDTELGIYMYAIITIPV